MHMHAYIKPHLLTHPPTPNPAHLGNLTRTTRHSAPAGSSRSDRLLSTKRLVEVP